MSEPGGEPFYFGTAERPLFGWLHPAEGAAGLGLGLVVVPPLGYEAVCAHRSLRHFAQAAASAGVVALRFDLDGTGDSSGDDREPGRVAAWITSIGHAIDAVRRASGVERVVLLGVRCGALLAASSAESRADMAGLIAIAPVVAGRAWSREMKALQMALQLASPPAGMPPLPEGEQEVVGFRLTSETREELGRLDLTKAAARPAAEVLIIDRDDLPPTERWAERLRELGAAVTQRREPGYVDMVADPHNVKVPEAMIAAALPWLRELAARCPPPRQAERSSLASTAAMHGIVESAVTLGGTGGRFGVLSAPASAASGRPRRAILLLNAGCVHHIGPNRLYVAFARRRAALGDLVLRHDLSGIGDSPARPGEPANDSYTARAAEDIAEAIGFLRQASEVPQVAGVTGVAEVAGVHVVGLCSGAYHAFKAAVSGAPIRSVVAINPLTFFWKRGTSLDAASYKVSAEAQRYAASARDPAKWKKLLAGQVNLRALARVALLRGVSLAARHMRDLARRVGRPLPDDLGAELEQIARRGVRLTLVLSASDPGLDMLRVQGGSVVPRLAARGALGWHVIDGPDHTFSPLWSHPVLLDRLDAIIDATLDFARDHDMAAAAVALPATADVGLER